MATTDSRSGWLLVGVLAAVLVMVSSSALASASSGDAVSPVGSAGPLAASSTGGLPPTTSSAASTTPATPDLSTVGCANGPSGVAHLLTSSNDPTYERFVQNTRSIAMHALAAGLPASDLRLPYLGPYPDQVVNGVSETGVQIASQVCDRAGVSSSAPEAAGVAYDGQSDRNGTLTNDPALDSNSVLGVLTVNSTHSFYPDSATPTVWGAQLNVVLANVTILGQRGYDFWVQNVVSYDASDHTLSFVDDTWNFTSYTSEMEPSSLVSWSPNGSDYTGTWVAFSQSYYAPPPFTTALYVNSSVNSAGDQVLWYNYTLLDHGHFFHASYDDLVFRSQVPGHHRSLRPAPFEASPITSHLVNEGYEFDAFIGADDGSNQLILGGSATEQLKYCSLKDCTSNHFAYANVPAAVNFGSQTGEETVGVAVNYVGTTAYLSAGPLIDHGLWNFTGLPGVAPGNTEVRNGLSISGSPVPISAEPYFFVFFRNVQYASEGYGWAADVPAWYLMPGTYRYAILLADYRERTGTLTVGTVPLTLTTTLSYSDVSGVYTPLWAFGNAQVAGISSSGAGTVHDQYVLFNNPTSGCTRCGSAPNGQLSPAFFSANDYDFPSFSGIFLSGTSAYVDVNAPPSLTVFALPNGNTTIPFSLNVQFYETAHVTLSHAAALGGWPAMGEIDFYLLVPASQNPAPQGDVYLWDSTHDLIRSNDFVAVLPFPGFVSPDQLVLYGGTGNVVWGNTFSDPAGVPLGKTYAGIGIAESGDLIYNNEFNIDNPVVLLPYNFPNVADCLPQCSESNRSNTWFYDLAHDTWNVTPQPASNVARTVNGFALSGNVMGPGYTVQGGPPTPTQGGNFYWNFGRPLNNRTTLPYVDRFYYSDWSNLFPLGCGTIQGPGKPCGTPPPIRGSFHDGIQFGGDYAPIVRIPTHLVTFHETGLANGTAWSVTLGAVSMTTTGTDLRFSEPDGTYAYAIAHVPGYHLHKVPYTGVVVVSGSAQTWQLHFKAVTHRVTFSESGLPSGTKWQVTIGGTTISTHGRSVTFVLPNGDYHFRASAAGHRASPSSGSVTVDGHGVTLAVTFHSRAAPSLVTPTMRADVR